MEKHEKKEQWKDETIRQYLQKAANAEPIPESLHPKQMEAWLRKMETEKISNKEKKGIEETSEEEKNEVQEVLEEKKKEITEAFEEKKNEMQEASKEKKEEIEKVSEEKKNEVQETSAKQKKEIAEAFEKNKNEVKKVSEEKKNEVQETSAKQKKEIAEAFKENKNEVQKVSNKEKSQKEKEGKGMKKEGKKSYRKWWLGTAATAACLAVVLFAAGRNINWEQGTYSENTRKNYDMAANQTEEKADKNNAAPKETEIKEGTTYKELYQAFSKVWKEEHIKLAQQNRAEFTDDAAVNSEASKDVAGETASGAVNDTAENASAVKEIANEKSEDYGKTNQQEAEVEEADIIKNDGRYLYQVIEQRGDYIIQIADTKDKLKEASTIKVSGGDSSINDIYVWKDTLVVLESGWARAETNEEGIVPSEEEAGSENPLQNIKNFVEDVFTTTEDTVYYADIPYSKIHVYNIKDRANPTEYHTFTIKGNYRDSRISDGYFYFFTQYNANKPRVEKDYKAYIPQLEGETLSGDQIYLPEDSDEAAYLVMASINMEKPDEFTDTKAIVTSADKFYVSKENIYISDSKYMEYGTDTEQSDSTKIFRFSYKDGKIQKEAEGTVQGTLRDDMAMNEYNGYLRMVTTVESQSMQEIKDDITGEVIGHSVAEDKTTNSLYVLDQNLEITGKIENLAKDEQVYSARFMGDSGYFVTFRQVDPLFSVDLSNPKEPKILGELKISGFSDYLHFYADNLLLGIGMEADENTGVTEGIKLSMFDISNPADVKEQSKLNLEGYDYSEALDNYKSVLIDTNKNLFGFHAEGYGEEYKSSYLLFSFENGAFREIMNIDCSDEAIYSYRIRGTYIGNSFYLMCGQGRIEEYNLTDGSKIGELVYETQE